MNGNKIVAKSVMEPNAVGWKYNDSILKVLYAIAYMYIIIL